MGYRNETGIDRHRTDFQMRQPAIDQHPVRARETLHQHKRRKSGAFGLEQALHIAYRQPVARRDRRD